ncbi:MAG: hypothetical protein ABH836_01535 [Candidatus Omnitrophota bacterium]
MKKRQIIICIISLILLISPLFWFSKTAIDVGGDDARLYFMVPENYISNFSLYVWNSYNSLSNEYTPWHAFPFVFIPFILKKIGLLVGQSQMLLYGITLMMGFLSAYLFIKELLISWKIDEKQKNIGAVAGALIYVFSPIVLMIDWQTRMPQLYGIFVYPLLFYFFLRALNRKRFIYLCYGALLSVTFSTTIYMAVPWFVGFLIGAVPLFAGLFFISKEKWLFLKYLLAYSILCLCVNIGWIVILMDMTLFNQTAAATYTKGFDSISEFLHNVQFMNVLYAFLLLPPKEFYTAIGSIFTKIMPYKYSFMFLGLPFAISVALIKVRREERKILLLTLITFLILAFCISVNITDLGVGLFAFLIKKVFAFAMFKNFQSKFSIAFSFFYAVCLGTALVIVFSQKWKLLVKSAVLLIILLPFCISARTLLSGRLVGASPGSAFHEELCAELPQNHFAAVDMLKKDKDINRVLIFPMARYLFMVVKCDNQSYYVGMPYIKILSGKECFEGILSFRNTNYTKTQDIVYNLLDADDYPDFLKVLWFFNIKYVYLYEKTAPESAQLFLFKYALIDKMKQALLKTVDKKISDFGDIELYRIPYRQEPSQIMAKTDLVKVDDEEWLSKLVYTDLLNAEKRPLITF